MLCVCICLPFLSKQFNSQIEKANTAVYTPEHNFNSLLVRVRDMEMTINFLVLRFIAQPSLLFCCAPSSIPVISLLEREEETLTSGSKG